MPLFLFILLALATLGGEETRSWTHYRSRRANAVQRGDHEEAEIALRDMRAAQLETRIRSVVDGAPPLTDSQRARLASLLVPPTAGDAA